MNYTRTFQDTPRIADIPSLPLSNVSSNAEMYGYNSLHPVTTPHMSTIITQCPSLRPVTTSQIIELRDEFIRVPQPFANRRVIVKKKLDDGRWLQFGKVLVG